MPPPSGVDVAKRGRGLEIARTTSRGREDLTRRLSYAAVATPRNKKDRSGTSTPKSISDPRRASAPSSATGSRVFVTGSEHPQSRSPAPESESNGTPDDIKSSKKKQQPKRSQQSTAAIQHSDGPVLQPKHKRFNAPSLARGTSDPSAFSYAQAVTPSRGPMVTVQSWDAVGPMASLAKSCPELQSSKRKPSSNLTTPSKQDSFELESNAPSVFDVDSDDDVFSDFNTEISSSSGLDQLLPTELDPDDRLLNPKQYFAELEDLEASVAANSGLFLMARDKRQAYPKTMTFDLKFRFESHCSEGITTGLKSYDEAIIRFCKSQRTVAERSGPAYWVFHALECRNLMLAITSNIERMKKANFCSVSINALGLDPTRPNVARLVSIKLSGIYELHQSFEDLLDFIAANLGKLPLPKTEVRIISQRCEHLLNDFGLPKATETISLWRQALMVLDLATVSYCGAHIERFDRRFLQQSLDFAKITAAWTQVIDGSEGIMLRRRSLRCLNGFLRGQRVWVFQPQSLWQDSSELFLSTTMQEFGDIWGPVWVVKADEQTTEVTKFNAGNGSIVPWDLDKDATLPNDESYCHWAGEFDILPHPKSAQKLTMNGRLLIGGTQVEQKTSQLKENEACQNRTNHVIQALKAINHLEYLGTRAEERYLSEEQYCATMGAYGVAVGGARVYKKRKGISLKDAICEAWKNGGGERNPAILEHWLGVEFSFCSGNARRLRLKTLLNSTTMRRWLESCKDNAEPFACEKAFQEAMDSRNPRAFRELYIHHREWRRDLGQLLSWCLEGLRHSQVNPEDGTLHVLWMPQPEKKFRVKIRQNTHSWTPFLEDTENTCAFSILSGKCLVTDFKDGAICQARRQQGVRHVGSPILETSLVVNQHPEALRPRMLELRAAQTEKNRQARWSISQIPYDESFRLVSGRLRVVQPFRNTRLVVKYECGIFKKLFEQTRKQMVQAMTKRQGLHHWELKDEDDWDVKPIPLFVISEFKYKGIP